MNKVLAAWRFAGFVLLVLFLGAITQLALIRADGSHIEVLLAFLVMFTPAICSILMWRTESLRQLKDLRRSMNFRTWGFALLSALIPVGIYLAALVVFALLGGQPALDTLTRGRFDLFSSDGANLGTFMLFVGLLGGLSNALPVLGEELAWRGVLLRMLDDRGIGYASMLIGVLWAIWHLPFKIASDENLTGSACWLYVLQTIALSKILCEIRRTSGSLLPVLICHGAWNATIGNSYTQTVASDDISYVLPKVCLVAMTLIVAALMHLRESVFAGRASS